MGRSIGRRGLVCRGVRLSTMTCWTCWGLRGAMGQSIGRRGGGTRRGYQAPGSQRYRGLLLATTCWTSCRLGATRWRAGRGGRRLEFVDVGDASATSTRICRTRRGVGSPLPRLSGCRTRGRLWSWTCTSGWHCCSRVEWLTRWLSTTAATSLPIGRSWSASSRPWASTGRRRRRRGLVVEIGRFFAGVVIHLDRSWFQASECHQL